MKISLGMDKNEVLAKLRDVFTVKPIGGQDDGWMILKKNGAAFETVGSITFEGGKVSWVSRDWGANYGQEAHEFARTLAGLISSLNQQGKRVASVTSSTLEAPNVEYRSITIDFGAKKVLVNIGRERGTNGSVSIQEILEE